MMADESLDMKLNPFASDRSEPFEKKAQSIEEVTCQEDSAVSEVLNIYDSFIKDLRQVINPRFYEIILNPRQIDTFLQIIMSRYPSRIVQSWVTGDLVSDIIKTSFDAGYNDFILTTGNLSIPNLPFGLDGSKKNESLRYHLNGYSQCMQDLSNCIAVHKGHVKQDCAFQSSKNCRITVYGDVGDSVGLMSKGSVFDIYGKAGESAGENCSNCTFTFYSTLEGIGTIHYDCRFRVTDRETYDRICKNWRPDRRIVLNLILPDGTVLEEKR